MACLVGETPGSRKLLSIHSTWPSSTLPYQIYIRFKRPHNLPPHSPLPLHYSFPIELFISENIFTLIMMCVCVCVCVCVYIAEYTGYGFFSWAVSQFCRGSASLHSPLMSIYLPVLHVVLLSFRRAPLTDLFTLP